MKKFKVIAMEESLADSIRHTMKDEFGNALISVITNGTGPCRQCLQPFERGKDERILFAYQPIKSKSPYTEVGPVYIHTHHCKSYADENEFPAAIKNDRKNFPLTLRCYNHEERMIYAELVGERNPEEVIEQLFERPEIEFLHARNSEYGCFIAKIERP